MKRWFKSFPVLLLALGALLRPALAQQQPVVAVEITQIGVNTGSGSVLAVTVTDQGSSYTGTPAVSFSGGGGAGATGTAIVSEVVSAINLTSGGSGYTSEPTVTISGSGSGATATATIAGGAVTGITITNGGSGFTTPPSVTISGGGGSGATATANTDRRVVRIDVTSGGAGYSSAPTVTLTGGAPVSAATATAATGSLFNPPNEAYGPAGTTIHISALASGTHLLSSFTYSFYVNGLHIGTTTGPVHPPTPAIVPWTPPQPGSYFLTVVATDGNNTATSLPVRFFATGVEINSPLTGTLLPQGSSVVLKADATVARGFINQIEFYEQINGGAVNRIGADTTLPYSFIYTPVSPQVGAVHRITARAQDNQGIWYDTMTPVDITIVRPIDTSLVVSLTAPKNEAKLGIPTEGNSIPILVDAFSGSGRVSKVELYVDGVLFGTNTNFPYVFSWAPAVVGNYKMVALAYDDKNNVESSPEILVHIVPPPSVALTYPLNGDTVTGGTPTRLTAVASDSNAEIRSVQFFVDGQFVGESTRTDSNGAYFVTATLTQRVSAEGLPLPSGVMAMATNSEGITGISPTSSVYVTNGGGGTTKPPVGNPPTVSLTSPIGGTQITVNTPVSLGSNPVDTDGFITGVQYLAGTTNIGSSTTYPYTATWTPKSPGVYPITVKVTDNDGNIVSSNIVTVTVVDPTAGTPPSVAITSPGEGASVLVGSTQLIKATPTVQGSVQGVQFFVNGQPLGGLITSFPYQTEWQPTSPGSYALAARVTNASGVQGTSAPVNVTVTGGTAPTVTLVTPTTGNTLAVNSLQTLTATATAPSSTITNVQFFVNGVAVGTDTSFPYSADWTPNAPGTYQVIARATDALGNTTDSTVAVVTVAGGTPPTVTVTNPAANSRYSVGTPLTLNAGASDTDGTIAQVQFFVNGVPVGAATTTAPYSAVWTPAASGAYALTARATDNAGNTTTSAAVNVTITANGAPTVSIIAPKTNGVASAGTVVTLTASAADADGTVARVRFLANGTLVGTPATAAPFSTGWTPSAAGSYSIVAEATDSSGNVTNSAPIEMTVITNQAPSVSIQSPGAGFATTAGLPVVLTAAVNDSDGTVAGVRFFVNGSPVGSTITSAPFSTTWTPTSAGSFTLTAEATDNIGNVSISAPVSVQVAGNVPPTVSVTSPGNGTTVRVGMATNIEATARDTDGTIAGVQFYVNGIAQGGQVTVFPYRLAWTPNAEGVYRISATALDNGGAAGSSSTVAVLAVGSDSASTDRVYSGNFGIAGDAGKFSLIVSGESATFIGYTTLAPAKVYYFPNMSVDSAGTFAGTDAAGHTLTGNAYAGGASLMLDNRLLIGLEVSGTSIVPRGHYSGSLAGAANSALDAIVGPDGSIAVHITNGATTDAAVGRLNAAGTTTVPLTSALAGSKITVTIDPLTGFMTGNITGSNGGAVAAALSSGAGFSDGSLRNLSTRGQVGTGADVLIAGFVVAGDAPKQVLVRAIGPTLAGYGVTGALHDPQLQLYKGATLIGGNDNWENNAEIASASGKVGAFALNPTARDAALTTVLAPGAYTAQVSGVNGATGIALVEIWDVDNVSPFAAQKVSNVSTRGVVGSDQKQLIAGFVVSGNISKKLLIRAVGPSLSTFGLGNLLADPMLRLSRMVNGSAMLVRENNDWGQGNDPASVVDAASRIGTFPLNSGSKDAVILITLPPGTYTAQALGAGGSTGMALIEVYEVP